jgi:hypothetical protein
MNRVLKAHILPQVHSILRRRFGEITVIPGRGITRGERVQFKEKGKVFRCAIKTSTGGRISFDWRDGKWGSGLTEADRVVIAGPAVRFGEEMIVSMFDQQDVAKAFAMNKEAQRKAGMSDAVPSWIASFHEERRGTRGVGDGFAKKALWSEPLLEPPEPSKGGAVQALTIEEAKKGVAAKFNISPDQVQIIITG